MLLIGLGHKARHGKNFVAKAMILHAAQQGIIAKEYAFADALKAHCRVTYGMRKKDPFLLQIVGTEVGRHVDPNLWVRCLMDRMDEEQPDVAIVTDMRFPNEVDAIQTFGGYTIKVERVNRENGGPWVSPDRDPNHASEIALDHFTGWHMTIKAWDGDQESLKQLAANAFDYLWRIENGKGFAEAIEGMPNVDVEVRS